MEMVQNVLVVWLNTDVDESTTDYRNLIYELRQIVNVVKTFTDRDECVDFLTDIHDEYICLIISGDLCRDIVPLIHDVVWLRTIFIFDDNQFKHAQWAKNWSKIDGITAQSSSISQVLEETTQQCEQSAIPMSFITTSKDGFKKNLNQLEPLFMYSQILKEMLMRIQFEQKHIEEFLQHCRQQFARNDRELNNIRKFETTYRKDAAIWWYTYECFLYPMLNRVLRLMDVNVIIKMGFYVVDLHCQIEKLYIEQFTSENTQKKFTVYRGQGMSKEEFCKMRNTLGGLISFNSFLSTSMKNEVSLRFARRALSNADMVGIIFVITVDPSKSTTPFASVAKVGCYRAEDEILFGMHTVFRIRQVEPMDENPRLFRVELVLTDENDKDLCALQDYIRKEIPSHIDGWEPLGALLKKMGQFEKAQQIYEILLEQSTDEGKKAVFYNQIGLIKAAQGEHESAIRFFEKAMAIFQKNLSSKDITLDALYENIGTVYISRGEYSKALLYCEKALDIRQQSLSSNPLGLSDSYNNIGVIYTNIAEYSKALSYHEKALEIRQNLLPSDHPDLASSYGNTGSLYGQMHEYVKALHYLEKSLEIQQKTLPPNHPHLAMSHASIGVTHMKMRNYTKAILFLEKTVQIHEQCRSPNYPSFALSYTYLGLVFEILGSYSKAGPFYERALEIGRKSLPSNHPHLELYKENLQRLKNKL